MPRQSNEILPIALAALLLLLALPGRLWAHDFWIEPQNFRPPPGARVPLRLYVGQNFAGESIPYFPERFVRYVVAGPAGERPIPGVLGDDPAGAVTPAVPGLYIIGLRTRPDEVSFDSAAEFEQYLLKEGLERNLALHRMRAQHGQKIRESYFRCAKSLLAAGTPGRDAADRALGLPLEFVAETNPYRAGKNSKLVLRLLYQDKPLAGTLVVLSSKARPLAKLTARTGPDGRVEFSVPTPGIWLATAVHMIPAPMLSSYDWHSLWASLTFEWP